MGVLCGTICWLLYGWTVATMRGVAVPEAVTDFVAELTFFSLLERMLDRGDDVELLNSEIRDFTYNFCFVFKNKLNN